MEGNNTTALAGDVNVSSDAQAHVELYSVVANSSALVLLGLPAALANCAVLVSTRCKKGLRCLQYGLHYTLFASHLLMCFIWLPLHAVQQFMLHANHSPHTAVCFLSTALFHFCLASLVFLVTALGALHLNYLSCAPVDAMRAMVSRAIPACFITALLLTALTLVETPTTLAHNLCVQPNKSLSQDNYTVWYSVMTLVLSVIYLAVLLIMLVLLWLAMQAIRQRIGEMLEAANTLKQRSESAEEIPDTFEISREEPSKHSSVTFKEPEISETIPENNCVQSIRKSPSPKTLQFKDVKPTESDEEDDDIFEKKMRLRMQKSGSGRRHTVANIGMGDNLGGSKRRGSLEVPQRGPTSAQSYNYIRKWSVDITALQAQLENPRTHGGTLAFRDLEMLSEKPHNCGEDEEEEVENSTAPNIAKEKESPTKQDPSPQSPPKSPSVINNNAKNDNSKENGFSAPDKNTNQTKAKVVSVSEVANDTTIANNVEDAGVDKPLLTHVPSIHIDDSNPGFTFSKDQDIIHEQADLCQHDEAIGRLHKKLRRTRRFLVLYALTLVILAPWCALQLCQAWLGAHLAINLTAVTAPLCVTAALVQPLLLVWLDTRMRQAMARLWLKLTHWTCVCYCNIGKGKRLFGKPAQLDPAADRPAATADPASTIC